VRALRGIRGFTQEALAERSDLHVDTIRRLELGEFSPSTTTLAKVARGLGVGRAFLVESDGPPGDQIELLVAVLHGKPPSVVRLAVRAAMAVVNECEIMAVESSGLEPRARISDAG
jgi:transcriptional regulator with XRE-family HTH domain